MEMAAGFFHPRPGVPRRARLLAEDLFDPRDRLVDRLLGADALGGDPVDGFSPAPPPSRPFCQTLEQGGRGYGDSAFAAYGPSALKVMISTLTRRSEPALTTPSSVWTNSNSSPDGSTNWS
jgi:hypothetical protein